MAWVETSLPAASGSARPVKATDRPAREPSFDSRDFRWDLARRHRIAIEVEDRGQLEIERYRKSGVEIATVQAYRLHDWHPLHREGEVRQRASVVVREAIETADRLDCRRVLTVCGFGQTLADSPFERCLEFFDRAGRDARHHGVQLLIEPLSPKRAAAFNSPREVVALLDQLAAPAVFALALDSGHLLDSGIDPCSELGGHGRAPVEVQLKGPGSTVPDLDRLEEWLAALAPETRVVAVEHREAMELDRFEALLARIRRALC